MHHAWWLWYSAGFHDRIRTRQSLYETISLLDEFLRVAVLRWIRCVYQRISEVVLVDCRRHSSVVSLVLILVGCMLDQQSSLLELWYNEVVPFISTKVLDLT